jgi:hypothetical protein
LTEYILQGTAEERDSSARPLAAGEQMRWTRSSRPCSPIVFFSTVWIHVVCNHHYLHLSPMPCGHFPRSSSCFSLAVYVRLGFPRSVCARPPCRHLLSHPATHHRTATRSRLFSTPASRSGAPHVQNEAFLSLPFKRTSFLQSIDETHANRCWERGEGEGQPLESSFFVPQQESWFV